jgi:REP element-mobilizing transposase RayT
LRRLEKVFDTSRAPLFFLTICVRDRTPALADAAASEILVCAWREALPMYGWKVGRYVVMPDHVHFFGAPASESAKNLSTFVGGWKRWTQRRIRDTVLASFAWQAEFFDHVMRGAESYEQKWEYVRANPVRAGLVARPQDWSNQGEVHVLCW